MASLMAMAFAVSLLSAATEAQPVSVLRLDFVREMTDGDGNRTVVERGRHFIADGGEYRMDKVSNGERISEIRLPAAGERFVVNHDLRLAVRGPLDGNWPVPASRALTVRPVTPAQAVFQPPPGYVEHDLRPDREWPAPRAPRPERRSARPGR